MKVMPGRRNSRWHLPSEQPTAFALGIKVQSVPSPLETQPPQLQRRVRISRVPESPWV